MTILFEKQNNGIAIITLNRPDVHNAFNEEVIADLTDALNELEKCVDTRVLIIKGNGKSFSAGADLDWMKRAAGYSYEENLEDAIKLSNMLDALYNLKQLTIAKVHGAAMGGGLGLLCCVDIVIADENSKFSFSEVKLGLIPATISPFVIKAIGPRAAKRYFQTGEFFTAEKAESLGLVDYVSSSEHEVLNELLKGVLKNAPQAMQDAKRLVLDYQDWQIDESLRKDSAKRIAETRSGNEAKEGLTAFFEKRKADWIKDV